MDFPTTPLLCHLLLFLLLLFLFLCSSSAATDTIFAGQSLTANRTLVSQGNIFELGFFSPGKSHNFYVGIWYKRAPSVVKRTFIWVANRDIPIKDPYSSQFKLLENGNLVLFTNASSDETPIWSTNTFSKTLNSTNVVLGDDGNLVLKENSSDTSSQVMWQSFDHLTDTEVPGTKLGYNRITKKGMNMTSWRNTEDPAHGIFSLQVEPDGSSKLLWNGTQEYYTGGTWTGHRFSKIPELQKNSMINYSFVSNENESYLTFNPYDKSLLIRVTVDVSGQLKSFLMSGRDQDWTMFFCLPSLKCDVYGLCGDFGFCTENGSPTCQCLPGFRERSPKDWNLLDYSGGCVRNTPLKCGGKDRFWKMANIKLAMNSKNLLNVGSVEDCKSACLNDCSCNACAYTGTCLMWNGTMLNTQQLDTGGDDLFIKVAASEVSDFGSTKKISATWITVGAISGFIVLIAAIAMVVIVHKRNMRSTNNGTVPQEYLDDEGTLATLNRYAFLTAFQYKDLKVATKNFSEKLGGGSFGTVFKGSLPDSSLIAVKKLEGFSQGEKQFRSEVSTIGLIQHVNLVRLRGFCSKGTQRILVYDFMPNGSLASHLFHRNDSNVLEWKTRYQIAIGTARGLAYLHEKCRDCIIHCDIKPENILLDSDFCPKVADFGLAKLVGREFSRVVTTIRGTIGYLAPEWSSGTAITAKADVYSYGMMLFEIMSGRRNIRQSDDEKVCFFPTWAATKLAEGKDVISMVDKKLGGDANVEEVTRAFRVACWCIQEAESQRPTMGQVVQILEGLLEVTSPPIPTYLQAFVENKESINFFTESST